MKRDFEFEFVKTKDEIMNEDMNEIGSLHSII